jgi:hypothetical protein
MPYDFQLSFSELCAFVPSADESLLRVLLVNAPTMSATISGVPLLAHVPRVRFDEGDVRDRRGVDFKPVVVDGKRYIEWELDDDNVVVEYPDDGSTVPLHFETAARPQGQVRPTTRREGRDFSWVFAVEEIEPDCAKVQDDCFKKYPTKDLFAARFEITSGTVETHSFSEKRREIFVKDALVTSVAPIKNPSRLEPQRYEQAMALVAGIKRSVSGGRVRLRATSLRKKVAKDAWVDLAPSDGRRLLVLVTNSPQEEPEKVMATINRKTPKGFTVGFDFVRYYGLSTKPGAGSRLPSRRDLPPQPGVPDPEGPKPSICGKARFRAQGPSTSKS